MSERGILIFLIFFTIFFWNILAQVEYEWNSGQKFFSLFLGLCQPVLAKNNTRKRFLIFLIFFAIFFKIFLPGSSMKGIRDKNFFVVFSAYLIPFWLEIVPEIFFLIFWIISILFLRFSSPGRVWTEFGTKIFSSLIQPLSTLFG